MLRPSKPAYDLTDAEKRDLIRLIQEGKPLPEQYRFILFEDKREVELVWNGKSREVCTTVLPFQSLEHEADTARRATRQHPAHRLPSFEDPRRHREPRHAGRAALDTQGSRGIQEPSPRKAGNSDQRGRCAAGLGDRRKRAGMAGFQARIWLDVSQEAVENGIAGEALVDRLATAPTRFKSNVSLRWVA